MVTMVDDLTKGAYDPTYVSYEGFTTVVAGDKQTFPIGTTIVFKMIPLSGYALHHWEYERYISGAWVDQGVYSTANPASFMTGTANLEFRITPVFTAVTYFTASYTSTPIIAQATIDGSPVSPGGSVQVKEGSTINISAPAEVRILMATTWVFLKWTVDGVDDTRNPITVVMSKNRAVVAFFQIASYTLTLTQTGQGSTDPAPGTHPYASNTAAILSASPASGWRFSHWLVDGTQVTANPLILQMGANHTVQAVFTQITVRTITIQTPIGQGTTIQPPGTYQAFDGDVIQITATPASGWQFDHWNGVASSSNPLNLTMTQNYTVQAVFTQIPTPKVKLTITVEGAASSPVAGVYEYTQGTTANLTAVAASGYTFSHWLLDGVTVVTQPSLDIPMMVDRRVAAFFTKNPPEDQLVLTLKGYAVWINAASGTYYIKKGEVIVVRGLLKLQEAIDWVNNQGIDFSGLLPFGVGVLETILSLGKK